MKVDWAYIHASLVEVDGDTEERRLINLNKVERIDLGNVDDDVAYIRFESGEELSTDHKVGAQLAQCLRACVLAKDEGDLQDLMTTMEE